MPHVSGHKEQTGLMSNPYKQAAESETLAAGL